MIHRRTFVLLAALLIAGPSQARPSDSVRVAASPEPDTSANIDPFARSRSEQVQSRWILFYGVLFAAAVGILVWRQDQR